MAKPKKSNSEDKKIVALYCRVSTHEQGRGDYSSLKSQEDSLKKYCEGKGWDIYEVYTDTKSGTNLEREGMQKLLRDAEEKKFNVVASIKLDRISRSVQDFLSLDQRLRDLDIDIVITTQHIDTTTPAGKMQRTILLAFGEFERDMIAERTREKMFSQAQKGYWGGGVVPLGYDRTNRKLVVNAEESKLVNKIFDRYLHEPSTAKVANWLNQQGYRTKVRVTESGKKLGGKLFNKKHVYSILQNEVYIGNIIFNGEKFKGLHTPIVSRELFNKVQKRLELSRIDRMAVPREESPLALLNIVKCGICGSAMTTSWTRKPKKEKKYYYYKCTQSIHYSKEICPSRDLKASELELFIEKLISHISRDSDFFDAMFNQLSDNSKVDLKREEEELDILITNRARIDRELKNLTARIADDDRLSGSKSITDHILKLEEDKYSLSEKIKSKEKNIEQLKTKKIGKRELQGIFKDFNSLYRELEPATKRRMNQLLISEIKSHIKKGENDGMVEILIRSDGSLKRAWKDILNQTDPGSSFRPLWYPREDSNLRPTV